MSDSQVDQHLAAIASGTSPDATAGSTGRYIIGVDYQDTHYNNGSSNKPTFTWYGDRKCGSGYSYYTKSMPKNWNGRVSSAANYPYSNCGGWDHYENVNFNKDKAGHSIDCGFNFQKGTGCYDMHTLAIGGEMSDRTSSERWVVRAPNSVIIT